MTDDTTGALSRLEACGPAADSSAAAALGGPVTEFEAVRRWLDEAGLRRGSIRGPSPTVMARAYAAHARARGWELEAVTAYAMASALRRLGYRRTRTRLASAYRFTRQAADALWAFAPPQPKQVRTYKPEPMPRDAPRLARWPVARPVRTCDGREWPSARALARHLGVSHWALQRAIVGRYAVRDVHVSYLDTNWTAKSAKGTVAAHEDDFGIPSPS